MCVCVFLCIQACRCVKNTTGPSDKGWSCGWAGLISPNFRDAVSGNSWINEIASAPLQWRSYTTQVHGFLTLHKVSFNFLPLSSSPHSSSSSFFPSAWHSSCWWSSSEFHKAGSFLESNAWTPETLTDWTWTRVASALVSYNGKGLWLKNKCTREDFGKGKKYIFVLPSGETEATNHRIISFVCA